MSNSTAAGSFPGRDNSGREKNEREPGKVSSLTGSIEKTGAGVFEKGSDMVSKVAENVGPVVKKAYQAAESGLEGAVDTATEQIRKYPVQALLVGFGIGCLAGFIMKKAID